MSDENLVVVGILVGIVAMIVVLVRYQRGKERRLAAQTEIEIPIMSFGWSVATVIVSIVRNEIQDPNLETVEVTMVEMLGDCARLWFTAEGDADRVPALDHAKGFMRRHLAESLDLKRTPDLRFRRDPASRQFLKEGL
jgi:ribosome-binding factor A